LKASTPIPIVGVKPVESKEARAEAVLPLFESGRVKIRANASWGDALIAEFLRFPGGAHDDQVDAVNIGLQKFWDAGRLYSSLRRDAIPDWKSR